MRAYRVPVVIRGFAVVKFAEGKATGDYISGLPRDAEQEVLMNVPFLCGSRMEGYSVELTGEAEVVTLDASRATR